MYVLSRKSAKEGPDNASEASQRREGIQWCEANGHVVAKADGDNEPASGVTKEVDLPKRAEALRMFRDGEIDLTWVANQSRISREGALKVAALIGEGFRFYIANRRLDTATLPNPDDDFLGCVQVLFEADADRKLSLAISENVRRSRVLYHDTGAWSGRAPYGTRVVGVKAARRLTNDPHTWPVVVRILRDTANGVSRRELARALTAEGIPSPGSYERDPETGRTVVREVKPWALGMITRIVHHPVYEGWLTVREHGRDVVYRHSQTGDRVWAFADEPRRSLLTWPRGRARWEAKRPTRR
ncbi:recombinase family protein [Actinomadura sp. SCN-SB]|uniref:recombinase family protein n=1 Tax=Actinomadura sp. SCN-SB TaxID=3373092 RepID=UPI0037509BEE